MTSPSPEKSALDQKLMTDKHAFAKVSKSAEKNNSFDDSKISPSTRGKQPRIGRLLKQKSLEVN
jgi:hypothetical protein